jgi:hypothetical protein
MYRQMLRRLLAAGYLKADETPVRCTIRTRIEAGQAKDGGG